MTNRQNAEFWCKKWGIYILDADGWRLNEWTNLITEADFFERAARSTIMRGGEAFQIWEDIKRDKDIVGGFLADYGDRDGGYEAAAAWKRLCERI